MTFTGRLARHLCAISTHTPLAGRDVFLVDSNHITCISTHTPLAGRDSDLSRIFPASISFLLTRPSRDVTVRSCGLSGGLRISTHTPLAGRDSILPPPFSSSIPFLLTRPSRDVTIAFMTGVNRLIFLLTRPSRDVTIFILYPRYFSIFLLTRPSRDVTMSLTCLAHSFGISTHTPLAGRDGCGWYERKRIHKFLLTRPSRDVTTTFSGHVPSRHKICERRTISLEKFL